MTKTFRIKIHGSRFDPDSAAILVNDDVFWANEDKITHHPSLLVAPIGPGESSPTLEFDEAGSIPYTCLVSGHMEHGTIKVEPPAAPPPTPVTD